LHSSIVCYEHHENFDGGGYPRKLKGAAISEFSRVIRVAAYDNTIEM
jgi:HD-GYP domain-containing protein (c-di-GMP phosphodiesterase class II)